MRLVALQVARHTEVKRDVTVGRVGARHVCEGGGRAGGAERGVGQLRGRPDGVPVCSAASVALSMPVFSCRKRLRLNLAREF